MSVTQSVQQSPFKACVPGYPHIDVKSLSQMADEDRHRHLFVAIDRVTRWVFVRIYPAQTSTNARRFLRDLFRLVGQRACRCHQRHRLVPLTR